jgi:hypothetical protein
VRQPAYPDFTYLNNVAGQAFGMQADENVLARDVSHGERQVFGAAVHALEGMGGEFAVAGRQPCGADQLTF